MAPFFRFSRVKYIRKVCQTSANPIKKIPSAGHFVGDPYSLGDPAKPNLGYPVDAALKLGLDERNGIRGVRVAVRGVDRNLKTSYAHNVFFGIQRELSRGLVVEASYLGSAGHRLYNSANINRFRGDLLDGRFNGLNPSFASINMIEASSNSIYHGGAIALRKAWGARLSVSGAYTFGKVITDADDLVNPSNYLDIANRRLDRSLAGFDTPRKLALTSIYQLSEAKQLPVFARTLLGGWQLAGFFIAQTGNPINITNSAAYPNGDYNADGSNTDRPNAPAEGVKRADWNRQQFLNGIFRVADFGRPAPGTNGNLSRNAFRGPGFAQMDVSLSKRFRLTERVSLQLRADAFNALNRVNLGNPVTDLNNINFGRATTAATPRSIQTGLKILF